MTPEPIVGLEGAGKSYGDFIALHGIDLTIAAGEFVTLLGPSGCGKTTTLRLIGGFETPDRGRVRIGGEDVTDLPPYLRAVNTVFQDYALFPHMSVAANVGYGLSVKANRVPRADRERRVAEALALVGLSDKRDQRPGQLSGGQRQRVAMARALVRKPRVLLLDEPLSALDVKLREAMQIELKHLHRQLGITFLMVTHDQSEALVLSDRVVIMRAGRIAQIGAPQELYDRPASPYVADFIGAANLIDGMVDGFDDGTVRLRFADGSCLHGRAAGPGLAAGGPVTVGVRPERLRISSGTEGLAVTVVGQLFHGGVLRLETQSAASSRPIFVEIQRASTAISGALPLAGASIRLVPATPEDVLVYPREEAP